MDSDSVAERIADRLMKDIFRQRRIDNNFRGPWTEFMVAEAIGNECEVVSHGWHPWDLQIGDRTKEFPERIRIQVKNTARLQTWHKPGDKLSDCQWVLRIGSPPEYFLEQNRDVPCESYGHLCDLYVLCFHPEEDFDIADHQDPFQWEFYLVPATTDHSMFPVKERPTSQKTYQSYRVRPESLKQGIRGRPPVAPLTFGELDIAAVRRTLAI